MQALLRSGISAEIANGPVQSPRGDSSPADALRTLELLAKELLTPVLRSPGKTARAAENAARPNPAHGGLLPVVRNLDLSNSPESRSKSLFTDPDLSYSTSHVERLKRVNLNVRGTVTGNLTGPAAEGSS